MPLIAPMVVALQRVKMLDTGPNPHNLVWHRLDGHPITPEENDDAWKQLLSDAGMPDNVKHACRHTAATALHTAGVPEDVRQLLLGHSSAVVTRKYVHVSQDRRALAMDNLIALMPVTEPVIEVEVEE